MNSRMALLYTLIAIFGFGVIILGWGNGEHDDEVITRMGEYKMDGGWVLHVKEVDKNIFLRLNSPRRDRFSVNTRASIFQKFYFYWVSGREELWFYSSDRGGRIWTIVDGALEDELLADTKRNIPPKFFDRLPTGIQQKLVSLTSSP